MIHSKFSLSFDTDDQSVTIFTTVKANRQSWTVSPFFNFDEKGRLIIPPNTERGFNTETFTAVARNIKTTVSKLKSHIESLYSDEKQFAL
tara:strand:- start:227 stop:496 length:270 start_codon:yes stop_codon:yes gene_type:complete